MSIVSELLHITKAMVELLREPVEKEKRDVVIEQIEEMLEKRELLLKLLPSVLTEAEKQMGKELLMFDREANRLLQQLKQQIQKDLKQMKQTKEAAHRYHDLYEPLSIDGMFYDKRR